MTTPRSRITSRYGLAVAALLTACILWGTSDTAAKVALGSFSPLTLTAIRFSIAALFLYPLTRKIDAPTVPFRMALFPALIGITAMYSLQNLGLDRINASNASLLQGATPGVTLVVAAILIDEPLGRRRIAAILFAGVGVVLMSNDGRFAIANIHSGDVMVLASMVMFGIFVVRSRELFRQYGTLPVVFAIARIGAITLVPGAAVEMLVSHPTTPGRTPVFCALYLGICCSALVYLLWGFAVSHLGIAVIASFDAIIPLVGCLAAMSFLGEHISLPQVFGGFAVLVCVLLVVLEPARALQPAEVLEYREREQMAIAA